MDEWLGKRTPVLNVANPSDRWAGNADRLVIRFGYYEIKIPSVCFSRLEGYISTLKRRPRTDGLMCGYRFIYTPIAKQRVVINFVLNYIISLWSQQIFAWLSWSDDNIRNNSKTLFPKHLNFGDKIVSQTRPALLALMLHPIVHWQYP